LTRISGPRKLAGGYRFLRSDGKPSFSSRIYRVESDAERLASKPPVTTTPTAPFIEAAKKMSKHRVRSLVVEGPGKKYLGMLLVEHMLSFLGGGELYDVAISRLGSSFYKCMQLPVKEMYDRDYPAAPATAKLPELVSLMIERSVDLVPIVDEEGVARGVVSVHDVVKLLVEKKVGVAAEEVMGGYVPVVSASSPLIEAIRAMSRAGIRKVVVEESGKVVGLLGAESVVDFFGEHEAFNYVKKGFLEEALTVECGRLKLREARYVHRSEDLGEVAAKMVEENLGAVLVSDGEKLVGMVTESDVFLALALSRPGGTA